MILGLTGSIGSGKSTVARELERRGALVIDADAIAREVVAPGTPGLQEVVNHFGADILTPARELDRARMASIVFRDPEKLRVLESVIHPRVRKREIELIQANRDRPLAVLEIPLLFESGSDSLCEKVLVVTIDDAIRRQRLKRDRGMSDDQIDARLASQMPDSERAAKADFIIDNSGTIQRTHEQIERLMTSMGLPMENQS